MSPVMSKTNFFAAVLAMASTTAAHMTMSNPVPFGSPNNSPLEPDGSDFPCKAGAGGGYVVSSMNEWTVGSDVTLQFAPGTATHGGGSCQVSVTKDKEPTKDSVWKVIHSIEGGCPTSGAGNGGDVASFPFTVPEELPEGQLTMAWTWFNKIGNREMYMNCAPIKVSGGSGKGFDSLPDMAVANIAGQGSCTTSEGNDFTFANPGKYVTKAGAGPYKELCGGEASAGAPSGGSDSGSGGSETPSETPSAGGPSGGADDGSYKPDGGNSGGAPEATTPPAGGDNMASAPVETPKENPSAGSGGACSEGALMCGEGGKTFGICSNGVVSYMPVSAGTTCANGAITRRSYMHRNQRRHV